MEENKIETPLSEELDSNVETPAVEYLDVDEKTRELMELVKAYNKMKRKEANKYQVSKKENKKKKAKRRMAKKSKR